jgi:protein SCO1/2
VTCALALAAVSASAQTNDGLVPPALREVGVTQKPDAPLPLELTFVDEDGREVTLADYFRDDRPVLLSLVYYRCPMLCNLVLDGLVDTLEEIDWVPGEQFEIVTLSIDVTDTPKLAAAKKATYLSAYGRPQAAGGWHFLTGEQEAIDAVADAVGFRYRYLPNEREFAHPAALFVLTPEGRVSRYLFGVNNDPRDLRLALVEAADGGIGSIVDQFLLYCYSYDAETGKYTPVAWRIMRLGGIVTLLALGAVIGMLVLRETRLRRRIA